MPTGAKLFSGIFFALLGWFAAAVLGQGLPKGMVIGHVPEASALAGLVCGWVVMGGNVGRGFGVAIGTGVRTGFVLIVVVLLGVAIWAMLEGALQRMYRDPSDALLGIFDQVLRYGAFLGDRSFLMVMVAGSGLIGLLAELVGRRWP